MSSAKTAIVWEHTIRRRNRPEIFFQNRCMTSYLTKLNEMVSLFTYLCAFVQSNSHRPSCKG